MKLFLKLIATGEEVVSLLPFTRKLLIHRRYREKVKEEVERLKINIQWQILFNSIMILYCIGNVYTHCIGYGMENGNISQGSFVPVLQRQIKQYGITDYLYRL